MTLNKEAVDAAFPVYAAEEYYDWALTDVEGDWELAVRDLWLGDRVNIGEYMYISFSNTEIIVRKDDDSYVYFEGGDIPANEGSWSLIAHGTDLKNEWGDLVNPEWGELVKSKPNWTINLI